LGFYYNLLNYCSVVEHLHRVPISCHERESHRKQCGGCSFSFSYFFSSFPFMGVAFLQEWEAHCSLPEPEGVRATLYACIDGVGMNVHDIRKSAALCRSDNQ